MLEQYTEQAAVSFERALERYSLGPLRRRAVTTLQVNIGRLCDLACHHCHVEAGPKRTENMSFRTAERVLELVAANPSITLVDLTGGAPEMNPNFRWMVEMFHEAGLHIMDRCNPTIIDFVDRKTGRSYEWVPEFLATNQVEVIAAYVEKHDTIEGAPELREEHLPIFDCAFLSPHGKRAIHHMGHVRMMGAVQPFLSGGISKTVNMPMESTVDDILEAYVEGWKLGLKSLAVYRDGSKRTQPLSTQREPKQETASQASAEAKPLRRKLPDVRQAITHKFSIAGHDGYLTVGLYEDGQPGEMFLRMAKEGSTISGLMDTVAIMTSIALQYGVPLKALVDKFSHTRFEPAGFTQNPEIPFAKSVTDYVFRWLGLNFSKGEPDAEDTQETEAEAVGLGRPGGERVVPIRGGSHLDGIRVGQEDAPPCMNCGSIMLRTGACHSCPNCGENGGCG